MEVKLIKTGYCDAMEHHAIKGGRRKKIAFDAIVGVIQHPEHGVVLFDTGYTTRFYKETAKLPGKIYAWATKVYITPEEELHAQLKEMGIAAEEVKHIIISHFHADHIGGMKDFPNAQFYCSKKAYEQMNKLNGFAAVSKGILKGMVPDDLESRLEFIDDKTKVESRYFSNVYDLFGDGLIQMVELEGHAAGQMGALMMNNEQPLFLVADAVWLSPSYKELKFPNPIVKLFFNSWKDYIDNLKRIHQFHQEHPDVLIIPTHCNSTTSQYILNQNKVTESV